MHVLACVRVGARLQCTFPRILHLRIMRHEHELLEVLLFSFQRAFNRGKLVVETYPLLLETLQGGRGRGGNECQV